jgi:hypothetical protein
MTFATEFLAFIIVFVYASFFEWFVHRYFMHVRRFPFQDAFRGHTMVHHQIYHGENFMVKPGEKAGNVALRWYAFPGMLVGHMLVFGLFQWLTGLHIFWGATLACIVYFTGYEYTHYLMHVPLGHSVEQYRWFQFLRNHHRLHHKYMLRNLNVFIPLADLCFGTLVTAEGWRSKPAKRQRFLSRRRSNAVDTDSG